MNKKTIMYIALAGVTLLILIFAVVMMLNAGGNYEEYYSSALELYVAGDYDGAEEFALSALEEDDGAEARVLLAQIYVGQGKYAEALVELDYWEEKFGADTDATTASRVAELRALCEAEVGTGSGGGTETGDITIGGVSVSLDDETLIIEGVELTSADLAAISGLSSLKALSLKDCSIDSVAAFSGLSSLTSLTLSDNEITDVSPLSSLVGLRTLFLDGNAVTNYTPLQGLMSLTTLNIQGMAIDEDSLASLEQALPNCDVYADEPSETAVELTLGGETFMSDVISLDLSEKGISDISVLSQCTKLETLNLTGNEIEDLSPLLDLQELTWLSLWNNKITDISPLLSLTKLEYLDIEENEIENISALSGMTALEKLYTGKNPLQSINTVYGLTSLKSLGLKEAGLTDEDIEGLSALTGLTELMLEDNEELSEKTMDALKEALPNCTITHSELKASGVVLGILEFEIDETEVSAPDLGIEDISTVANFTDIVSLDLNSNLISDISALSGLTTLESLDLSGNYIESVSALSGLTAMQELNLDYNTNLSSLSGLSSMGSLKSLDLSHTAVTDLSALSSLRSLESLSLDSLEIDSLEPLHGMEGLTELYLFGAVVEDAELDAFLDAVPTCNVFK